MQFSLNIKYLGTICMHHYGDAIVLFLMTYVAFINDLWQQGKLLFVYQN
jgi:hypothetical protein